MLNILKIFLFILSAAHGLRTCTIIAPEYVHSDRKFSISLAVHNLNVPSQFEVTIESASFKDYQVVPLQPNGVQLVEFQLPELQMDEFVLRVQGESGIYAKMSTLLKFSAYKPIFAIQTDKKYYKTGETLHFRILCLNEELRPVKPHGTVDVRVTTPDYNQVSHNSDIEFDNYVAKGEIFLNAANFMSSKIARLAVFMNGELQADVTFTVISNGTEHEEMESNQRNCHPQQQKQLSLNMSSMATTKVIPFLAESEMTKPFFSVELKMQQQATRIKQSELAVFKISASISFQYFTYTVIGRGNVLSTGRIALDNVTNEYEFNLKPSNEMAPLSKLIIYFIDADDNFHYDEAFFNVERKLENELNLSTPPNPAINEKVQFHIQTAPNSYVGLLAVEDIAANVGCRKEEDNNGLNIAALLRHFGGHNKLQRGELTGTQILTTANFEYKTQKQQKTWLEKPNNLFQENSISPLKTWFFAHIANTTDSNTTLTHNLPNDDRKWRVSAFALNAQTGLAFTKLNSPLQTEKSYNISFDLPKNLHAQEVFVLTLSVENFLHESIGLKVEFVPELYDIELMNVSEQSLDTVRNINVGPWATVFIRYTLRTKTAGIKYLKFLFFSKAGNDRQVARLNVKPKGLRHVDEFYQLIDLRNATMPYERLILPSKPYRDIIGVQDSDADVYTNLFQPIAAYFEGNIFDKEYQTAEQIVSIIAIAKLSLDYLQSTVEDTEKLETLITRQLHLAFMVLLDFRNHDNGGFNFFAYNQSGEASVWLTAYIMRWLPSVTQYVNVDETILEMAYDFMAKNQNNDGSFTEKGVIINASCANDSLALTAHVVWAFLEQKLSNDSYKSLVERSLKFIVETLPKSENLYAKALALRVLNRAGLQGIKEKLQQLDDVVIGNDSYMFGAQGADTNLNNVATTALILLTSLNVEEIVDFLPALRWLIEKGNIYAFTSAYPSYATVHGLEAILYFATELHGTANMEFTIGHQGLFKMDYKEIFLRRNETNHHHHLKLNSQVSSLRIQASGQGFALAVIRYDYTVNLKSSNYDDFVIHLEHPKRGLSISFELKICVTYKGKKSMADLTVLDVGLLSGYTITPDEVATLVETVEFVKHAFLNEDVSKLEVLLLGLKRNDQKCFTIELQQVEPIAKQIQAAVTCYDYTDPSSLFSSSYAIESSLCDLCNFGFECPKKCD